MPSCTGTALCLSPSNAIVLGSTYDGNNSCTSNCYGNLTQSVDAKGQATNYIYDTNKLYLSQTVEPGGTAFTTQYQHDPNTGLLTQVQDYNGFVTTFAYDVYGRLTTTQEGSLRKATNTYKDGSLRIVTATNLNSIADMALRSVTTYDQLGRVSLTQQMENNSDSVNDPTTGIKVQTRYRSAYDTTGTSGSAACSSGASGSYQLVSNPYRSASSSNNEGTMGWTQTNLDGLGRAVSVQTFDGSTLPGPCFGSSTSTSNGIVTAAYNQDLSSNANVTQYKQTGTVVTDQAGNTRASTTDGLGRLAQLLEDPNNLNYSTTYSYGALDDLANVAQGSRLAARVFQYDSLERLSSSNNPESGTITYGYDLNGNLMTKTDARGITTTMTPYDARNRMTGKSYNDGTPPNYSDRTPAVSYCYDAPGSNGSCTGSPQSGFIGRLTQVSNANVTTTYSSYDGLGRVTASAQTSSGGSPYSFAYAYNPSGGLISETFPSGRVVSYGYDGADRISSVTGQMSQTTNYVQSATYAAHGALAQMMIGANAEISCYNDRLQPSGVRLTPLPGQTDCSNDSSDHLNLAFGYSISQNNGNMLSQTIKPLNVTQSYGYDTVNRLSTGSESGSPPWQQTYVYDPYGNRAVVAGGYIPGNTMTPQVSANDATLMAGRFPANRTDLCGLDSHGNALGYDAAGNWTGCPALSVSNTFDAENRMISSSGVTFAYDGSGNRVQKVNGPSTTNYVYSADGQVAAEYSSASLVATGTQYLTADHLGSTRLVVSASGVSCHDFLPFGEEIDRGTVPCYSAGTTDGITHKFTGQERDAETGMDNFLARHFASAQGRFMSPDPAGKAASDPTNPQSWNLYSYVMNNSLMFVDPSGLIETAGLESPRDCIVDGGAIPCALVNQESSIPCPGGDCSRARQDPKTGNLQYLAWTSKFVPGTPYLVPDGQGGQMPSFPYVLTLTFAWVDVNTADSSSWPGTFANAFFKLSGGPGGVPTCAEAALGNIADELAGGLFKGIATEQAAKAASAFTMASAWKYAAGRPNSWGGVGLIKPLASGTFRALSGAAELLGEVGVAITVYDTVKVANNSIRETAKMAQSGACAAAFPVY